MGLFVKKIVPDSTPLYSLGNEKTRLIVGLGNPGTEYAGTRHNVGFMAVDLFVSQNDGIWHEKKDLKCAVADVRLAGARVLVIKPSTFMNLSGEAVGAVQRFYKLYNADTLVVHDEFDIPLGTIKTKVGGGHAGHNGIKSASQHIGEDYGRLRIGIGHGDPKRKAGDSVLGKFSADEQAVLPQVLKESSAIITEFIFGNGLPTETRSVL
jgi:PTH1 family peptidyl-tRNA hydrolase